MLNKINLLNHMLFISFGAQNVAQSILVKLNEIMI